MTVQERIALIGRLWDSLDADMAAPISPAIAAELSRREVAADQDPDAGRAWPILRDELRSRLP